MRVLVLADVGGPSDYHVGDEAMLAANLAALRELRPDIDPVVASRCPAWTRAHHRVDAVARLDPSAPGDGAAYAELERADALLVSGGGNLSSTWPSLLGERTAMLRAAREAGKPTVLSGQTIGPNLSAEHRADLADALHTSAVVGVRERWSHALAGELGVPQDRLLLQHDDALLLAGRPPAELRDLVEGESRPWIAVTVHPFVDPAVNLRPYRRLSALLDEIVAMTGARLLFIPHQADGGSPRPLGDARVGHLLARGLRDPDRMVVLNVLGAREACWVTQHADAVLSTRYHPLIFGLAGGVPGLGLPVDEYTRIKLTGVLEIGALGDRVLPLETALDGALPEAFAELWGQREQLAGTLAEQRDGWERAEEKRRRRIATGLGLVA